MNLKSLHQSEKEVSAVKFFKGELGINSALEIQKDVILKSHISQTPAVLLCVNGWVVYHEEDRELSLKSGDYVEIPAMVPHWLTAKEISQLILMK